MTMLKELGAEVVGMFVGDLWLSLALLGLVALCAALIHLANLDPLLGGGCLLVGCLGLLVSAVLRAAH